MTISFVSFIFYSILYILEFIYRHFIFFNLNIKNVLFLYKRTFIIEPLTESYLFTSYLKMERITGIEPALSAWEAEVLPLNYIRTLPRGIYNLPQA